MPAFAVDIATALQGVKVDVGEVVHCDGCDGRFYEGAPVTAIARTRTGGWDIETIFGPHCAPDTLDAERRDSEGIALAEAELAVVLSGQQAWMMITRVDVLEWKPPRE
jgi:hypothetical protein